MVEAFTGIFLLQSVMASLYGAGALAAAKASYSPVVQHLKRANDAKRLPQNHYIERGTVRACIGATQQCITEMAESEHGPLLDDVVLAPGEFVADRYATDGARSAVQQKLHALFLRLDRDAIDSPKKSKVDDYKNALSEASLQLTGPTLDTLAGKALSMLNDPNIELPNREIEGKTWAGFADLTTARKSLAPNLEAAVLDQVLKFGVWPEERRTAVHAALSSYFFDENERWLERFALFYAEEVRADEKLHALLVLLRLERLQETVADLDFTGEIAELGAAIAELEGRIGAKLNECLRASAEAAASAKETLSRIRQEFAFKDKLVFMEPDTAKNTPQYAAFRSFYFGEEQDDFVGRSEVLSELDSELLSLFSTDHEFKWAAICGDAGVGKSRLALQILNSKETSWRLSGFVRKDFLLNTGLELDFSNITGPTLFVIDYAGSAPRESYQFLERCCHLAKRAPFPVRALLLLRRTNDRFFDIVDEGEDGAIVANHQVRSIDSRKGNESSGAFILGGLDELNTISLMKNRMLKTRAELNKSLVPFEEQEDLASKLLAKLGYFDASYRPLLALIVADSYAYGELDLNLDASVEREEALLTLLWDYLKRQFNLRWKKLRSDDAGSVDDALIDRHLTFLILSTMCRGLHGDSWLHLTQSEQFQTQVNAALPVHPDDYSERSRQPGNILDEDFILAHLCGMTKQREDAPYPFLEPDLIGESLVLMALSDRAGDICNRKHTRNDRKAILKEAAWHTDAEGVALFSVLVAQDFPNYSENVSWLLPQKRSPDAALHRGRLFRNLVLTTVSPLLKRAMTKKDVERMEALLDAFSDEATADEEASLERASAICDMAEWLSFAINKTISPRRTRNFKPLKDKAGRRKVEFEAVAQVETKLVEDVTDDFPDPQNVFNFSSDKETVQAAVVLQRRLFEEAIISVFDTSYPSKLRLKLSNVIRWALSSIFWVHRNDVGKFGYAPEPLSEEERQRREQIGDLCEEHLSLHADDETAVAVVANILPILIYAEHGNDTTRGQRAFEAIQELCSKNGITQVDTINPILSFFDNHVFNETNRRQNENNNDPLDGISNLAITLLDLASTMGALTEVEAFSVAESWCAISVRIAYYEKLCKRATDKRQRQDFDTYLEFVEKQDSVPLSKKSLDLFGAVESALGGEKEARTDVWKRFARHVQKNGYFREALNDQNWAGLTSYLELLINSPIELWEEVECLFELAGQQIGRRVNRELAKVLSRNLAENEISIERAKWLVDFARGGSTRVLSQKELSALLHSFVSVLLLEDMEDAVFEELEALWREGDTEEVLSDRTLALQVLELLLTWQGEDRGKFSAWRTRVLSLVHAKGDQQTRVSTPNKIARDRAVVAVADRFIQLELKNGRDIDEWLPENIV